MNYAAHNQELHGTLKRPDEPVIFTKADSAILNQGKPFFIPDHLGRIDYETEVVVRICRLGKNIPQRFAHRYYDALTIGIDFTARDLQKKASEAGQPWTICKGFDGSAAIGEWIPKEKLLTDPEAPCEQSGLQRLHFHLDIQSEEDRGQGREGRARARGKDRAGGLYVGHALHRRRDHRLYLAVLHTEDGRPALYRHPSRRRARTYRRPSGRLARKPPSARIQL